MSTARILIADSPEGLAALRRTVASAFDLVHAPTLELARQALQEGPALVVCGAHFDEGRMYDLLRLMKADPALARLPFVAVRLLEGELDDALYESVKIAVRALGGDAFVDLPRWSRKYGAAEAGRRLTTLLDQLLARPGQDSG